MITGKDIHAAFREVTPFQGVLRGWDDIHPTARTTYDAVAKKLNAAYLTPLQGGITGEAFYKLMRDHLQPYDLDWEEVGEDARHFYDEKAVTLNVQYLAPLQGLARDWQELLQAHDEMSVMSLVEIEDWHKDWEQLKERSKHLCGESTQPLIEGVISAEAGAAMAQNITDQGERIARLQRENDALKAVLTSYRVYVKRSAGPFFDKEAAELLHMVDMLLNDEQKEK